MRKAVKLSGVQVQVQVNDHFIRQVDWPVYNQMCSGVSMQVSELVYEQINEQVHSQIRREVCEQVKKNYQHEGDGASL
jgi:hypothetical protein